MDDLPSLTDSLLGTREEWARWEQDGHDPDEDGRRKRRK
jgi:dTMP kinase